MGIDWLIWRGLGWVALGKWWAISINYSPNHIMCLFLVYIVCCGGQEILKIPLEAF